MYLCSSRLPLHGKIGILKFFSSRDTSILEKKEKVVTWLNWTDKGPKSQHKEGGYDLRFFFFFFFKKVHVLLNTSQMQSSPLSVKK